MNYTKEDYEYLKNFEPQFNTAIHSHFVRMDNRETLGKLDSIYQRIFHRSSNLLGGCNRCVCDGMVKLGTLYYKDKEEYEKKAKNSPMELIQPECATTETTKEEKAPKQKKTTKNKN